MLNGAAGELQFNQAIGRPTLSSVFEGKYDRGKALFADLAAIAGCTGPTLDDEKSPVR